MTIGAIIIPYTFTNLTETADAVKVNSDFAVLASVVNEIIAAITAAQGSRETLAGRLAVALNDDGTLKSGALPVGSYDTRTKREVTTDTTVTESDFLIWANTTDGILTVTLPPSTSVSVEPTIINVGLTGNNTTVAPDGTDTVMGLSSYVLSAGEVAQFACRGTNWWRIR